jgi:hypothetical protein
LKLTKESGTNQALKLGRTPGASKKQRKIVVLINQTLKLARAPGANRKKRDTISNEKGEIIDINGRLVVPQVKIKEILEENHDHMLAGHLGIAKTISSIKRQYTWKGMKKDVVARVTSCILCARRKEIGTTKAPLQPLPPVYEIWERIAMDVVGKQERLPIHISNIRLCKPVCDNNTDEGSDSKNCSQMLSS